MKYKKILTQLRGSRLSNSAYKRSNVSVIEKNTAIHNKNNNNNVLKL